MTGAGAQSREAGAPRTRGARAADPQRRRRGAEQRGRRPAGAGAHAGAGRRTCSGCATGWVWLLDPETRPASTVAAAQNLPPYLQEPVRMTGRSCWCIEAFRAGRADPDQHRRDGVQPPATRPSQAAGDRADAGAALPRQHPALLPGHAARDHERRRRRPGAQLTPRRAAAAVDDRLPGRHRRSSARGWPRRARAWPGPRSAPGSPARSTTPWRRA